MLLHLERRSSTNSSSIVKSASSNVSSILKIESNNILFKDSELNNSEFQTSSFHRDRDVDV